MNMLLGVGIGMVVDALAIFFICDRPQLGWYGTTPMLCFYGITLGVIATLIAGVSLSRSS